jgi:hypothetical protein
LRASSVPDLPARFFSFALRRDATESIFCWLNVSTLYFGMSFVNPVSVPRIFSGRSFPLSPPLASVEFHTLLISHPVNPGTRKQLRQQARSGGPRERVRADIDPTNKKGSRCRRDPFPQPKPARALVHLMQPARPISTYPAYRTAVASATSNAVMLTIRRTVADAVSTCTGWAAPSSIGPIAMLLPAAVFSRL